MEESETGSIWIRNEPNMQSCMHSALPFCTAIDNPWDRNEVSLNFVACHLRNAPPQLLTTLHRLLTPHAHHLAKSSYLAVLSRADRSAAAPAWTDVSGRYDVATANGSATVSPHARNVPIYRGPMEQFSFKSFWQCVCSSLMVHNLSWTTTIVTKTYYC